ncbi:hypothetical protein KL909_003976 [Ogataea angusta]|nr:hypothetical protein KL909_003976 [Ogataea angusta]
MRKALESKEKRISSYKLLLLGFLVAFGIFNRVTFVAWLVLPSIFVFRYGFRNKLQSLLAVQSFLFFCLIFIAADSYYFTGSINTSIITPLNNLLYNSKTSNLAQHGLHPYYQHILVNYPTMFGPLIFLAFPFTTNSIRSTSFLTMASGVIVLSLVPHQELRFLIPMVPLWASCVNISRSTTNKVFLVLWIPFNLGMLVFMGKLHQGGVVPALQELQQYPGNYSKKRDISICDRLHGFKVRIPRAVAIGHYAVKGTCPSHRSRERHARFQKHQSPLPPALEL